MSEPSTLHAVTLRLLELVGLPADYAGSLIHNDGHGGRIVELPPGRPVKFEIPRPVGKGRQ
jgi:hypothetical protein